MLFQPVLQEISNLKQQNQSVAQIEEDLVDNDTNHSDYSFLDLSSDISNSSLSDIDLESDLILPVACSSPVIDFKDIFIAMDNKDGGAVPPNRASSDTTNTPALEPVNGKYFLH